MASSDAHRKLTAILCADVQGYSCLMQDEQATLPSPCRWPKSVFPYRPVWLAGENTVD